jgi:hypothetical protein
VGPGLVNMGVLPHLHPTALGLLGVSLRSAGCARWRG